MAQLKQTWGDLTAAEKEELLSKTPYRVVKRYGQDLNAEEVERCHKGAPWAILQFLPEALTPERWAQALKDRPGEVVRYQKSRLTREEIDQCFEAAPIFTLNYGAELLNDAQWKEIKQTSRRDALTMGLHKFTDQELIQTVNTYTPLAEALLTKNDVRENISRRLYTLLDQIESPKIRKSVIRVVTESI